MHRNKLGKVRAELTRLSTHGGSITPAELQAIAKRPGRSIANRGKEPTFVRDANPELPFPLSIPNHKPTLKQGTARDIIRALPDDIATWETYLNEQANGNE